MKLVLEAHNPWPVQMLPGQLPITESSLVSVNDLVVVVRPFDPLLNDWNPWKAKVLEWGAPRGGSIDKVAEVLEKTRVDWPVMIVDSLVKDVEGKVVEARLTALYLFLEWCTMAAVCARPDKLASERERALELLRSGRPDWSGPGIASIAQLYDE